MLGCRWWWRIILGWPEDPWYCLYNNITITKTTNVIVNMKNARRVTIFATFEQLVNILFWEVRLSSGEGVLKNDSLESLNRRFYHSPDHFLKAVILWPWDGMNILMVVIRDNDILQIGWLMKTTAVTKYFSKLYISSTREWKENYIHYSCYSIYINIFQAPLQSSLVCSACSLDT